MHRRSRPSGRPSNTSQRTRSNKAPEGHEALRRLIEALPAEELEHVFTHSSWAPDRASSYERLEFLGDSVLELATARALYERYPDFSEGRMAKIRSHVVSRASCAEIARELGLGEELLEHGRGVSEAELERLAENRNVLAALLEAALAAVYLRFGFEPVEDAIVAAFDSRIEYAITGHVDFKTELQEALARRGRQVVYEVLDAVGPPHERTFTGAAQVAGERMGEGTGSTKKAAEQAAAKQVLERLELESGK
jgi:ribonuclease-3